MSKGKGEGIQKEVERFAGFTFEELVALTTDLDTISAPTDASDYKEAADILIEHLPAEMNESDRQWMRKNIEIARSEMTAQLAPRDSLITKDILLKRVKIEVARNVRTRGVAGTFRDGIGENKGPRIRITLNRDPSAYDAREVAETLLHEYVHASCFLRGEDDRDDSNQFGKRYLNALAEWNQKITEIDRQGHGQALEELKLSAFGRGQVYEGPIGRISNKVVNHLNKEKIEARRAEIAQDPRLLERKRAFPKGVPTLHRGDYGAYRSNDSRYLCEKEGSEWVLMDKEETGVETFFGTLAEAKAFVEENYMAEWRQQQPTVSDAVDGRSKEKPVLRERDQAGEPALTERDNGSDLSIS